MASIPLCLSEKSNGIHIFKMAKAGVMVLAHSPSYRETEVGGLLEPRVQGQPGQYNKTLPPGQHSKTPPKKKKKN